MSCAVGHRCSSDPELLWLWCRQAAIAPIGPLAWELPHAVGVALKQNKTKQNKTKQNKTRANKEAWLHFTLSVTSLLTLGSL